MADIRLGQTSSGRWVVTLVNNNNVPDGLIIPVTLTYQGGNPVYMDVKKGIVTSATTEWYTPVGTRIDPAEITVSGSKTVGEKTYTVTKVNWNKITPAGGGGDELTLSYSGGNISYNGGTASITVTCTTDWIVTSDKSWARVSPGSGSGDGSVTVTFDSNSDTSQREVTLTGKTSDGTISKTLTIYQNGKPAPSPTLTITPSKQSGISADGETIRLTISSNTSWSLSKNQSWATFVGSTSGSDDGYVDLRIDRNDDQNSRKVTVTGTYGNNQKVTVELTQNAGSSTPTLDLRLSVYSIDSNGGQVQVFVENCNTSWTLTSNQDWAELQGESTHSGEGNKTVNLSVEPYTSGSDDRIVTIKATYGNNQQKQVTLTQTAPGGGGNVTYELSLNHYELEIDAHETAQLTASFKVFVDGEQSGNTKDVTEEVTWTSDDQTLVSVNASGEVLGNNSDVSQAHSTMVTATYNNTLGDNVLTKSCNVTVRADDPSNYYAIFINQQGNPTTASNTVSGAGTVTSLSVSANTDWHITCEPVGDADNWLTIDSGYESGGAGRTQLHLTKTANPSSLATRQAALKVYIGNTLKSTCIVTQEKAESVATRLEISVSDDVFPAAGGQLVLTIVCDDSWKLVNFPTWARPSVTSGHGNHQEEIVVQEYTGAMSDEEDRTGTYEATAGSLEDSVEILQRHVTHETPVLEPHAYMVLMPGVESTHNLGVTVVNIPSWSATVTSGSEWLSINKLNESIDIHVPNYLEGAEYRDGTIKLSADGGEVEDKIVTVRQTKAIINITVDPEYLYDDETIVIKQIINDQGYADFTKPVINIESNVDLHYSYTYSSPPTANPNMWFFVETTPTGEDHNAVMQFTTVQHDVNRQCNRNGYIDFYLGASEYDPYVDPDDPDEPVQEVPFFRFKVVEASHIWVDPDNLAYDRFADSKTVTIEGYGFYTVEENMDWLQVTGDVVGEDYGYFKKYITASADANETWFRREGNIVVKPLYNDNINITVSQSPRMFAISPTEYQFPSNGGYVDINIQTQQFWLAVVEEGGEDWITLSRTCGTTTDNTLRVTAADNTGGAWRGGYVRFYDADDPTRLLGTFRAEQLEGDSIVLNPESFTSIGAGGDEKYFNVIANGPWEITDISAYLPSGYNNPDIQFSKMNGNGSENNVKVTIGENTLGREIRVRVTFTRGYATAIMEIWQRTAVAPEIAVYYDGVQKYDQDKVTVDDGGGDLEFTVIADHDWSATLFAYEADGETYFATFPESTNPQNYTGTSGETTFIVRVKSTQSAQNVEGWIRFYANEVGTTTQITVNLERTGVSNFVPMNVSDVELTMDDGDDEPLTKQAPFGDTDFGDLQGDIVSMNLGAYLQGNGVSANGVVAEFGIWDLNEVPGHELDGCAWSNVTQVCSFTCTNQSGEQQISFNVSSMSFDNTAGTQSIAIALKINVAGTSYYAKLDTAGQGGQGFIEFTNGFYAIYI